MAPEVGISILTDSAGGWFHRSPPSTRVRCNMRSAPRGQGLHSVLMRDYVWYPDKPASGDVRTYGIYSFRDVIRSKEEYGYDPGVDGPLLFGKVKIWGEIVEHEAGYRSEFGKIASLDSGDPELLDKFRKIYRVNHGGNVAR